MPSTLLRAIDYRAFKAQGLKCIESLAPIDQFGEPVPTWQVFDLTHDPTEAHPLAEDDPRVETCRQAMARRLAARPAGPRAPREADEDAASEEALKRLRALGYIE